MPTQPSKNLETFPNPNPGRDYIIEIEAPEFTCLCPKTGQPDFATLLVEYVPDKLCVELKSLKLYIWSYRNEGHFHEDVTNRILYDLVTAVAPRYLRLTAQFNVRGGIYTTVEVEHRADGWSPPPPPPDHLPRIVQELPDKEGRAEPPRAILPGAAPPEAGGRRFRMLRRAQRPAVEAPPAAAPAAPAEAPRAPGIFIGLDVGSTGCRAAAINAAGELLAQSQAPIPAPPKSGDQATQDPTLWWKAVSGALQGLLTQVDPALVRALAVDGTSGTVLLCDDKGNPVTPALMYNDQRAAEEARRIAEVAAGNSGAQGASGSLAKLLWLQGKHLDKRAAHALHQADWIAGRLAGLFGHSDYNNCLKLGYDAEKLAWPEWMEALGVNTALLPQVRAPGEALSTISADMAKAFGLPADAEIMAGTTDGVAAFLAAGATEPGEGVTSLGSTLVLKLLSHKPVFSPAHGVYSHRLGRHWLAGGASNSGGAVLLRYFKLEQIEEMTPQLDPEHPTGLDYYPLVDAGERFPVNDPELQPKLEPLPDDSVAFLQGMLEGIARIEAHGYRLLQQLGAPALKAVYTTGGGSRNPAWERIREKTINVKLKKPRSALTAYGAALLAAGIVTKMFK